MITAGRSGLAIIGGGKIGEALLAGLVRQAGGGGAVLVVERSPQRAAELAARHGVTAVDLAEAAARARVLLLAVKPQDIDVLLDLLAPHVTAGHLVVSLAAGVPTSRIEAALPDGTPVVRVMPNTPALVDAGMSVDLGGGARHRGAPGRGRGAAVRRWARCGGCPRRSRTRSRRCRAAGPPTSSSWSRR